MLIRAAGPDGSDAQVILDFVTPRFRDFAPGEFVWRDTSGLRSRGYRRVLTPPDMTNAYYDRLEVDFRREGSSYVLSI